MQLVVDASDLRGASPVGGFLGANWIGAAGAVDQPHLVAARALGLQRDRIGDLFSPPGPIEVTRTPKGQVEVDFSRWREVLEDTERNLGSRPMILLTYMPEALWPEHVRTLPDTEMGPAGRYYPPASWQEWEELVGALAAFNVGIGQAGLVYELWNEPDMPHFWSGTVAEYAELYVRASRAIKQADPSAVVGGPSVSRYSQTAPGSKSPYVLEFLKELKATAERLEEPVHLDFLSFHHYPNCWLDRPRVAVAVEAMHVYLEASGIGLKPPMSLTEWASEGGEVVSLQRMASHPVQTVADQVAGALERGGPPDITDAYYYRLVGADGNTELLVPGNDEPLDLTPAASAFQMLATMTEGEVLATTATGPVSALATRDGDTVRVLLTNDDEDLTHTALVRLQGLPWEEGQPVRVWRWTLDPTEHWDHVHLATEPPRVAGDPLDRGPLGRVVEYDEPLASTREIVLTQHLGPSAVLQIAFSPA